MDRLESEERHDYMRYLAKKRRVFQQQQQEHQQAKSMDRRRVIQKQPDIRDARNKIQHSQMRARPEQQKEKPPGYEERKRLRELERRGAGRLPPEPTRDNRDIRRDNNEYYNRNMPVSHDQGRVKYDYNNRARHHSPSSEEDHHIERKYTRNSGQRPSPEEARRSRDISKRKQVRNRSSSHDDNHSRHSTDSKRRKRVDSSNTNERSDSHLRELEFRSRALQSLLNKKEEQNKQIRRRDNR